MEQPHKPPVYRKTQVKVRSATATGASPNTPPKPSKPAPPGAPVARPPRPAAPGQRTNPAASAAYAAQQQRVRELYALQKAQQQGATGAPGVPLSPQEQLAQQMKYQQQQIRKQQILLHKQQQQLLQAQAASKRLSQRSPTQPRVQSGEFTGKPRAQTGEFGGAPNQPRLPVPPKPSLPKPTQEPVQPSLPPKPTSDASQNQPPLPVPPKPSLPKPTQEPVQPSLPSVVKKPIGGVQLPILPKAKQDPESVPLPTPPKPEIDSVPLPTPPKQDPESIPLPTPPKQDPESVPLPTPPKTDLDSVPLPTPPKPDPSSVPLPTPPKPGPGPSSAPRPSSRPTPVVKKPAPESVPLPTPPKPGPLSKPTEVSKFEMAKRKLELEKSAPPLPGKPTMPKNKPIIPAAKPDIPEKPNLPAKPPSKPSSKPALPAKPILPSNEEVKELSWPVDKTPFESPDDPEVIIYDSPDETKPFAKPKIKAATIEKLVEKATHPKAEPVMQKTFLLTYRSIITPMELLDLLKLRYSMPLPEGNEASLKVFKASHQKPIQLRVCQLLKSWVQRHFTDFENDEELRNSFMDFAVNTIKPSYPVGGTLESIMNRQVNGEFAKAKEPVFAKQPKAFFPKNNNFTLLDLNPLEVARQMTLIETKLFRNIAPNECNGLAWSKKDAKERSPNILKMINRFNQVSDWVVTEIVKPDNPKQRTETLSMFIEIAARCESLNNLNGAMEIISALGNSAVHRLKMHWAELSKKVMASYDSLKEILSSNQSYKATRDHLKKCEGACIPYLGMYLTDLTFIEDGNPDKTGDLHNFAKRIFVSNVIQEIQQYQQTPYNIRAVPAIQEFLQNFENNITSEQAYQRSLEIIPRGGAKAQANNSPATTKKDTTTTTSSPAQNTPTTTTSAPQQKSPRSGIDFGPMEEIPGYVFTEPDTNDNLRLITSSGENAHEPPEILAATLTKLVERITFKDYPDPRFLEIVLLTYRNYTTGIRLMELLFMRFNMPQPVNKDMQEKFRAQFQFPVQLRVLNVLKTWTDKHPEDFLDKSLRETFFKFCNSNESIHASKLKRMVTSLKQTLANIRAGERSGAKILQINTENIMRPFPLAEGADPKHLKLYDFHVEEVARQLCIAQFKLFYDIRPLDLLSGEDQQGTPLAKMIRNAQILDDWVLFEIFSKVTGDEEHDLEIFKEKVIFFLDVTDACFVLGNYHSFCAIFQALSSPKIKEYEELWSSLPSYTISKFNTLQSHFDAISDLDSFRAYTSRGEKHYTSAAIPPVKLFLEHVSKQEEIEPDVLPENNELINIAKFRKHAVIVNLLMSYKNTPYTYETVDWLNEYINTEIPRLASFLSGISFVEHFNTLDPEKIKASVMSQLVEDSEIHSQITVLLKETLKEQLDEAAELEELYQQMKEFKDGMRNELQVIYDSMDIAKTVEGNVDNLVKQNFPDNDTLEEWISDDQEGFVYGWPDSVLVHTMQHEDNTCMVFSKSYVDRSELSILLRLKSFYEQYSGTKDVRVLTFAGYIDSDVREVAQQNDVELIPIQCV